MGKKANLTITIILGLVCSVLTLFVGVMAIKNYTPSFNINLSYTPDVATKIELALNDGTFYVIFDTSNNIQEIPSANVSKTKVIKDINGVPLENLITLGSVFANISSADVLNFKIWNYDTEGTLSATANATTTVQSDINSQESNPENGLEDIPAFDGTTASYAILDFSLTILYSVNVQINLDLILDIPD